MANTFTKAPYIILPGGTAIKGASGVQDSVNLIQQLVDGGAFDKYDSAAEIVKTRKDSYARNSEFLRNNLVVKSVYQGYIDRPLIEQYLNFTDSVFKAEAFTVPSEVYGVAMTYDPVTTGFKIAAPSPLSVTPVTPLVVTPVAPVVVAPIAITPAPLPVVKTELPPATSSVVNNFYVTGNSNVVNNLVAINSTITGTSGNDELIGTEVAETIKGGFGADVLKGGLGDDILIGNQDNDQLFGGEGADVLWGGLGDDLICPNQGNDISYGNQGADRFILCKGQDTIKDFNFAEGDRILVFGDAPISYGMSGGNFQIYRGTDTVTTLEGVTFATFDPTKAVLQMG